MTLAALRDFTLPDAGSTTTREVISRALARALAELAELASSRSVAPASAREEIAVLGRILRGASRGALASSLRRPTVGAPLRCLRTAAPAARDALVVEVVGQLAFDLALAGALPEPVTLRRWPERFLSIPSRVAIKVPTGSRSLRIANGATAGLAEPPERAAFHQVSGSIVLALHDNNPLALVEAHPDKAGNAIDLGGRPVSEWTTELAAALAIVERYLPDLSREIDLVVAQLVPVGWDAEAHLSASYREAIGTVYLSLHPSRMTLAEALIHEASHNKLNALLELDEVLENAFEPLYASPVRPDPRPLHGVLLAVHAFLPIARLYQVMIEAGDPLAAKPDFRERFAAICRINHEGAEIVLEHARPTRLGAGLLDEIRACDERNERYERFACVL